jgi:hypothetical protein
MYNTMTPAEKLGRKRKLLSFDKLDAHLAKRAKRFLKETAATDCCPLLQDNTEHLQPFDAGDGAWWNQEKRNKIDVWCDKSKENMRIWSSTMSARDKRILITHIIGEAQMEREKKDDDFRTPFFERTGAGVRIDGTGQERIKPQAMENFTLPDSDDASSLDSDGWSRSDDDDDYWGEEHSQDGDSLTGGESDEENQDTGGRAIEEGDEEDEEENEYNASTDESDRESSEGREKKRSQVCSDRAPIRFSPCGLGSVPSGYTKSDGRPSADIDNDRSLLRDSHVMVRTGEGGSWRWTHCIVDGLQEDDTSERVSPGTVIEAHYGIDLGWIQGTVLRRACPSEKEDAVVGAVPQGEARRLGVGARTKASKPK